MTRMLLRAVFLALVFAGGAAYVGRAMKPEQVPPLRPFNAFPSRIGEWSGRDAPPFSAQVLEVLGVDEYLNRVYARSESPFISLYVGYYRSQRQGDAIHSPMNCMPGAGWEPVEHAVVPVVVQTGSGEPRTISVNEYVVQKGADRQLLLYWYQRHGRAVANEYMSRVVMVYDAVRLNRTDAALVRVLTPIVDSEPGEREAAAHRARAFAGEMFQHLSELLPS